MNEVQCLEALKQNPNDYLAYTDLALIYQAKNDPQTAEVFFKKAIQINPKAHKSYEALGTLYKENNFLDEAKECYEAAVALNTGEINTLFILGQIYLALSDYKKALQSFEQVITINPHVAQAHINIGMIHLSNEDFEEAEISFKKALELDANRYEAYANLGVMEQYNNRLQSAKEYYDKALAINPNYSAANKNLAYVYLLQKEYIKGFKQYRYRYESSELISQSGGVAYMPTLLTPGVDIKGKKVYINHEQGFGDTIHFVRYFPEFLKQGAHLISYVPTSLKKLFEYNYPDVNFIFPNTEISFDYNFPMLESAYLLGTTYETIPYAEAYLHVDPKEVQALSQRYELPQEKIKVGINFRGSQGATAVKHRSMELEPLLQTLSKLDERFVIYSLQYERSDEDNALLQKYGVTNLGQYIEDFYDTAVMIESMDIIVSIDTSLLHLAGALGKESVAMLKFDPDWRWGLEGNKSNWYESITLLRQPKRYDWESVLKELLEYLQKRFV